MAGLLCLGLDIKMGSFGALMLGNIKTFLLAFLIMKGPDEVTDRL